MLWNKMVFLLLAQIAICLDAMQFDLIFFLTSTDGSGVSLRTFWQSVDMKYTQGDNPGIFT